MDNAVEKPGYSADTMVLHLFPRQEHMSISETARWRTVPLIELSYPRWSIVPFLLLMLTVRIIGMNAHPQSQRWIDRPQNEWPQITMVNQIGQAKAVFFANSLKGNEVSQRTNEKSLFFRAFSTMRQITVIGFPNFWLIVIPFSTLVLAGCMRDCSILLFNGRHCDHPVF